MTVKNIFRLRHKIPLKLKKTTCRRIFWVSTFKKEPSNKLNNLHSIYFSIDKTISTSQFCTFYLVESKYWNSQNIDPITYDTWMMKAGGAFEVYIPQGEIHFKNFVLGRSYVDLNKNKVTYPLINKLYKNFEGFTNKHAKEVLETRIKGRNSQGWCY